MVPIIGIATIDKMGESIFSRFISSEIHIAIVDVLNCLMNKQQLALHSTRLFQSAKQEAHPAEHFLELRSQRENEEWGYPGKVGNYRQVTGRLSNTCNVGCKMGESRQMT